MAYARRPQAHGSRGVRSDRQDNVTNPRLTAPGVCHTPLRKVQRRIIVLDADLPHFGQPVGSIDIERGLACWQQVPGLALVGPVVRLERGGGTEVLDGCRRLAGSVQVLPELEVRGGGGLLQRAWAAAA